MSETHKEINSGRGCDYDEYSWGQTLKDVTVTIPVPAGTRSKDIKCRVTNTRLDFTCGDKTISGEFYSAVSGEDSVWSLEDRQRVILELPKHSGGEWWPCVLKGSDGIDVSKISPEETSLSDLDPETRQMVEKMMIEQRMKQAGQAPGLGDDKNRILQQFMASHPEMDFSQAKFQ